MLRMRFISNSRGDKATSHSAVGLLPTRREKHAKDRAPTVGFCQRDQKPGPRASRSTVSVVPPGLVAFISLNPRTYVRGYIMPPLRGWGGDDACSWFSTERTEFPQVKCVTYDLY